MEGKKVIIIGSGLGGLMCGAILAREGYQVEILEKNRQLGGSLQIFARNKCIFDTGVHYIGGLGPGENLHHFFSFVGIMDKLKISRLDRNQFDIIGFEQDPQLYPLAQGYDAFLQNLTSAFPEEK
ncbi:MAG: NAD(P)-binding protein, partial [Cytophagales bacterium]|nr:NAD(P)-binding protein [Cytophagales bacterium]